MSSPATGELKRSNIVIGDVYETLVSGSWIPVRVTSANPPPGQKGFCVRRLDGGKFPLQAREAHQLRRVANRREVTS